MGQTALGVDWFIFSWFNFLSLILRTLLFAKMLNVGWTEGVTGCGHAVCAQVFDSKCVFNVRGKRSWRCNVMFSQAPNECVSVFKKDNNKEVQDRKKGKPQTFVPFLIFEAVNSGRMKRGRTIRKKKKRNWTKHTCAAPELAGCVFPAGQYTRLWSKWVLKRL